MQRPISDIAFSPAVKAAQEQRGSREVYARMDGRGGWQHKVTADLAEFIADRDSFYLATATLDGQYQRRQAHSGHLVARVHRCPDL